MGMGQQEILLTKENYNSLVGKQGQIKSSEPRNSGQHTMLLLLEERENTQKRRSIGLLTL